MSAQAPVFAMIAGEASGDILGADLIRSLKKLFPDASFEGIGGPKMKAEGFQSLCPMERLSVMGFIEPLKRLPELLGIRRAVIKRYRDNPPIAFIGIDAPDFNLTIELKLRIAGVKTIHYVSPSVWAWRQGRIKKIKKAVDLMLCLFPFEADFYRQHKVPVRFVGHPLAGELSNESDILGAREALGLDPERPVLCIMPGSRASEVQMLTDIFLESAERVAEKIQGLQLVIPAASAERHREITALLESRADLSVRLLQQRSHLAMEASDVVLLASGTTALEAMLLKKPMVVSYKLGVVTYRIFSLLVKTPFVSIPNLLANKRLVPELIQADATPELLSAAMLDGFDTAKRNKLKIEFAALSEQLALESGSLAAMAIAETIDRESLF